MSEHRLQVDPIPREARRYQGNRAGVITRTVAGGIDYGIVTIATLGTYFGYCIFMFLLNPRSYEWPSWPVATFLVVGLLYMVTYLTISWATLGRTFGAQLLGVRVVNFRGNRLRWPGAFLRAGFCAVFPVGLYWCIVSGANRSIQDVVLRTSVIHDWASHHRAVSSLEPPDPEPANPEPASPEPASPEPASPESS